MARRATPSTSPSPPLAIQKSFTDDPVPPGGTVTLEFTIDNFDRIFSATSIAFTDVLPGGLSATGSMPTPPCGVGSTLFGTTTLTLEGGNLPAQGSCTFSVTLTAGSTIGAFTNTSSAVTGDVDGSPVTGNAASETVFIEPVPRLTKTFMGDPVNPGDTIVLEFTVTNTSTTSSATAIAFQDLFDTVLPTASVTPGNGCCGALSICTFTPLINPPMDATIPATLSVSGGSLAPAGMAGDSCTFSITLDVLTGAETGIYPNTTTTITATVDGATRSGDPASDSFEIVAAPTLGKSFTNDPVAPGGTVTLEFTLTHSADATVDATGILFTDDLAPVLGSLTANLPPTPSPPCGTGSSLTGSAGDTLLTFMGGTLMPGESCTFSVTLNVPGGAASGNFTNTTSGVTATIGGMMVTSPAATDDLQVQGLTFSKVFMGDPVIPGDTVTLRFTIENVHPTDDPTSIVVFTDNLDDVLPGLTATVSPPAGNTCGGSFDGGTSVLIYTGGSVMTGMTCTIEVEVLVPVGAPDGTFINTTSNLTAIQSGGLVIIDPAVDSLTVNSNLLQLTKSFTDDPAVPGGTVTLEFIITNLDAANLAGSIAFTDDLSAALSGLTATSVGTNTCSFTVGGLGTGMLSLSAGTVGAGGTCTLSLTLTLPGTVAGTMFPNTTSGLTGIINTFAVSGDPATDTLVVGTLNLALAKSFGGSITAGGTQTLTFTITNLDTSAGVTDLSFFDDLDAVVSGLEATGLPANDVCGTGSVLAGTPSFLTLTGASLAAGGSCMIPVTVMAPLGASTGMFLNTTSPLLQIGLPVALPASATLEVVEPPPPPNPSLLLVKGAAPTSYDAVGQPITYTYNVTNDGNTILAGPVTVDDDQEGTVPCPALTTVGNMDGNLDPLESVDCTVMRTISADDLQVGSLINDATASAGGVVSNSAMQTVNNEFVPHLEPIPTLSEWGLIFLTMTLLGTGIYYLRSRDPYSLT